MIRHLFVVAAFAMGTGLIACQSMPKGNRAPAFDASTTGVADVLHDTDKIRIKVTSLQALTIKDNDKVFISARLLMCLKGQNNTEKCHDLGGTQGLDIFQNQTKDFSKETSSSMAAVYSPVVEGAAVNNLLKQIPQAERSAPCYLKVELRKTLGSSSGEAKTLGFIQANFPAMSDVANNSAKVLRKHLDFNAGPNTTEFGGGVDILIQRP